MDNLTTKHLILFCLLSFYISLLSCKKDLGTNEFKKVIIAGNIHNSEKYPDNNTIKIIINDFTQSGQRTYVSRLNENGNFIFDFVKFFPQDIYLRYGEVLQTLFVHPGDSLWIQFDADEFMNPNPENGCFIKSIKFSGDAVQINQDLNSFLPNLYETYSIFMGKEEKYKTLAPSDFKSYILSRRDERLVLLMDFINKNKPSRTFVEWANFYLDYECGREIIRYTWYNPFLNKRKGEQLNLPDDYFNFNGKVKLDNASATICSSYKHYLEEYYIYLRNKAIDEKHQVVGTKEKLLEYKTVLNYLEKNVHGFPLEFMLSHEFYSMLDYYNLSNIFEELYPIYEKNITKNYFKNALNEKYTEIKLQEKNPEKSYNYELRNQPIETKFDEIFPEIIEKNKGKVIYIDFWATWCGPCLIEMPFSLKLQNEFKGQEVAFIYLCVKSKKDQWENKIIDYRIKGDNYLLNDSQYDILSELFQITGIPHYVLINKKGDIVDKNAMRPSSGDALNMELIGKLKKLLKD
jgi:thiol-disulfide isomerase/thioredoxin